MKPLDNRHIRWASAIKSVGDDLGKIQDNMLNLGYEDRVYQSDIMWDIVDSLDKNQNLLVEAGVGIGKSFAYLLPGALFSMYYGKPLIVATSSIHLTEQLVGDIKSVEAIIGEKLNNYSIEFVVAKGRDNYPCTCTVENKIRRLAGEGKSTKEYEQILDKIKQGADKQNPNGINTEYWDEITEHTCDSTRNYNKLKCPFYKMRNALINPQEKMLTSRRRFIPKVIIVNQNLLMAHYKKISTSSNGILPSSYSALIIDEVHKLEEVVRDTLTIEYRYSSIERLFKRINRFFGSSIGNSQKFDLVELCEEQLDKYFNRIHQDLKSCTKASDTNEDFDRIDARYSGSENSYKSLLSSITKLIKEIDLYSVSGSIAYSRQSHLLEKESEDILNELRDLKQFIELHCKNDDEYIVWGKLWANKSKYSISYCPDNVDKKIKATLFNNDIPTIGLSATITMNESYDYIIRNIGFEGDTTDVYESPFPYDKSRVYIPEELPDYSERDAVYFEKITNLIVSISENVRGGTLVLFTAKTDLKEVSELIKNKIDKPIHIGLKSADTKRIIEKLKVDHGIVLGTGSFWEGIDLKGDFLTNLIIVRLPFPTPDPVIQRKIDKSSQEEVIVPEMLIKLRQGNGRLIRTSNDVGLFSLLDSRMSDVKYKHRNAVLKGLPIKNTLFSLAEVKEFQRENIL